MELTRMKRKICDVSFGSVVYIEDPKDSSNKKEKMYIVLNINPLEQFFNEEGAEYYENQVFVARLFDGDISMVPDDTLVEIIDCKLELDY